MCIPGPQLYLFTTIASGMASYQANQSMANAEINASIRTAERIDQEKQMAKLNAEQEETDRMKRLSESMASNIAFRAYLGRDASDPSFKAFEKSNYETYETDIKRIGIQSDAMEKNYNLKKTETLSYSKDRARSLRKSGLISLLSNTRTGISEYKSLDTGESN